MIKIVKVNKMNIVFLSSGVYKKMRGEEARLSENSQDMEKVKQQHYIQEDKVWFYIFFF